MLHMDRNFEITHQINTGFSMPQRHIHDFYEIYFTTVGGCKICVNDRIYNVEPNDMFVFNRHDFHQALTPAELEYDRHVITFKPDFIRDFACGEESLLDCFENRSPAFVHKLNLSQEQADAFLACLEHPNSSEYHPVLSQKIHLASILLLVNSYYTAAQTFSRQDTVLTGYSRILPALDYISHHLNEPLTIDTLATQVFMNKFYFCKQFKAATGHTVNEYINLRRVMVAAEYLMEGRSVSEVSELVGYQSDTYFITRFKDYWNISPKQFAKSRQQSK